MSRVLNNSLSYLGVLAKTPPNFVVYDRAPLARDYKKFNLGDIWLQKNTVNIWMLTDKQSGSATWTRLNLAGSATFTDVTITPGNLILEAINYTATLRTQADGTVIGLADGATPAIDEGTVYHINDSGVAGWGDVRSAGATVTITTTVDGINLEAAGGTAVNTYTTDDGFGVVPDGAGNVDIAGGANIGTIGAVAHTITFNLDDDITLTSVTTTGDITVGNDLTINGNINGDINMTGDVKIYLEINTQAGTSYTLILDDASKEIQLSNIAAITLTIPTNAAVNFPVGTQIILVQYGAGTVTVVPAGGVTLNSASGMTDLYEQYSSAALIQQDTNIWLLCGDIR